MRFLFRWVFRLFLVFVVLVVALVLLKDALIKSVVEQRIRSATGLMVKIGKIEVGVWSPMISIENLRLYNPAEFGGSPLLDMPELHVECDRAALSAQKLRLKLVRCHLSEVNIVESREGRTNVVDLMAEVEKVSVGEKGRRGSIPLEFGGIDVLNLTLGKVKYFSFRRPAENAEVELGLRNQIVTNVKSTEDLSAFLLKIVLNRGITLSSDGAKTSLQVGPKPKRAPESTKPKPGPRAATPSKPNVRPH